MKNTEEMLAYKIQMTAKSLEENTARLTANFYNELEWVLERMVVDSIKLNSYKMAVQYGVKMELVELRKYVSRNYNVMGTSTCQIRNFKTAYEFKTKMELITELENLTK
jgi:hypothetical protein